MQEFLLEITSPPIRGVVLFPYSNRFAYATAIISRRKLSAQPVPRSLLALHRSHIPIGPSLFPNMSPHFKHWNPITQPPSVDTRISKKPLHLASYQNSSRLTNGRTEYITKSATLVKICGAAA